MTDAHRYFATGVSMITSRGNSGDNVMAAEWTMQISYDPMLIAIFIHKGSVTLENILKTKEFGVNVASNEQSTAISTAGGFSRSEIDKMSITDVFRSIKPKKIKTKMIQGCTLTAECKLVMKKSIGDHIMIVGKALHVQYDKTKNPLIYHKNRYFQVGKIIEPDRKKIHLSQSMFEMFEKNQKKKFILKYTGAIIKSRHGVLILKQNKYKTIPLFESPTKADYKKSLEKCLDAYKIKVTFGTRPILRRVILHNKQNVQRVNFVLFVGRAKKLPKDTEWDKDNKFLELLL